MEPWLSRQLGQPVIIENRSGASTNIAVQAVVNSPPDGYTLLWHGLSSVVNASLYTNLPFDIQRDIDPAAGVVSYPMIMVAHPSVPAKSVAELIAHAKANPGKVTIASFRHRLGVASGRRTVQVHGRHRHGAHPISRRRTYDDGPDRRSGSGWV